MQQIEIEWKRKGKQSETEEKKKNGINKKN